MASEVGSETRTGIIDAHVRIGTGVHLRQDVDALLRAMDEAGVSVAVACPMDRHFAVANREGNELVLKAVAAHTDRLAGMAVANPWFGPAAAEEVRRALERGLLGVALDPTVQGFRLSDHLLDPLLQAAADFRVPVYAPTGTAGLAEPFHLIELARRFPGVSFIMGHGGASDYYNDAVRGLEFASNVWLETSRNGPANYALWKRSGVTDRVVFGSGAPEYIPAVELENLRDVFTEPADREKICGGTIRQVFRGRLPA
ncbi:MAG: hypothetical protein A2W03_02490 [Candidatus Aminicenantes bacterium RBG_16_63_16]|nr:MAG: hypothetical protein A2W03_02490 [Candidatus Aminicenantes bacterium RBG_16_63_16]